MIAGWLAGQSAYTNNTVLANTSAVVVPAVGGNWGVGLGARSGGVGSNKADHISTIIEIGGGYPGRQAIPRNTTGWPDPTSLVNSSYQCQAPSVTFTFTAAATYGTSSSASLWFVAGSNTAGDDNALWGADMSTTRTFQSSDQEIITAVWRTA